MRHMFNIPPASLNTKPNSQRFTHKEDPSKDLCCHSGVLISTWVIAPKNVKPIFHMFTPLVPARALPDQPPMFLALLFFRRVPAVRRCASRVLPHAGALRFRGFASTFAAGAPSSGAASGTSSGRRKTRRKRWKFLGKSPGAAESAQRVEH